MNQNVAPAQKSLTSEADPQILCVYINTTNRMQLLQMRRISKPNWQRVVFPGERLMFEALAEAQLEIHFSETIVSIIPCQQLQVIEPSHTVQYNYLTSTSS
ncbi:MAG TPA: hypothetical protein DDZ80_23060 [Cyanobacteria bacterium UBA8803]|nr:hypothetical protein [Cyanobacteria bacterium UBA8803]